MTSLPPEIKRITSCPLLFLLPAADADADAAGCVGKKFRLFMTIFYGIADH